MRDRNIIDVKDAWIHDGIISGIQYKLKAEFPHMYGLQVLFISNYYIFVNIPIIVKDKKIYVTQY